MSAAASAATVEQRDGQGCQDRGQSHRINGQSGPVSGHNVMSGTLDIALPPGFQTDSPVLIPDRDAPVHRPGPTVPLRPAVPLHPADGMATPELCHRPYAEDLFPVEWLRLSEHRFLVSVEWPAAHRFFAPLPDGRQDPMLVAETTRQATMMLAHAAFGVPVGDQFVMREIGYTLETPDFTVASASGPIEVVVDCSDVQLRAGRLVGMRVDLRFQRLGRLLATSIGVLTVTSARVYGRLRGERMSVVGRPVPLLPAVPPHETGRADRRDVVLALSKHRPGWRLRLDTTHPTLFARANDHVPGMVLLEAARQAAAVLTPGHVFHPASLRVSFQKYCELAEPCWILARHDTCPDQGAVLRVEGLQGEEPVFAATLGGTVRGSR
ncbi:ScbA/BarX family gamma-butyrolactone biosynthesis protein [Streptomyces sp. NPDC048277]|uniref:ScbA/BarX family gamma-butyrolactone biosynthesis protein n=1 Tax=Streptomyces sp. NPDC048277 TaxID=3155027 RepID=UPI00340D24E9